MVKSLLPILFSTGGVVAAGVIGYAVVINQPSEQAAPAASPEVAAPEPEATEQPEKTISLSKLNPKVEEVTESPKPAVPTFSLLRVEPDGSAVIAGSGPASSTVKLYDGSVEIAMTKSDPGGDFAFVLDEPLKPGPHELSLVATTDDGQSVTSDEAGLVSVPEPDKAEELAVLVTTPGEASRILVKPEPTPKPDAEVSEPVVVEETEEVTPEEEAVETSSLEVKADTENLAVTVEEKDPLKPKVEKKVAPVLLEAAEIEGSKLFIAGTGEPGTHINIYMGDDFLGQAKVADNGAFLFEGNKSVEPGRHKIRADMTNTGSVEVIARAEVDLIHEPAPVEVATTVPVEEPTEELAPEPAEVATVETQEPEQPTASPEPEVTQAEQETAEVQPETATTVESEPSVTTVELAKPEEESTPVLRTGAAVIIRRGDSLWKVARRNYGAGIRYTTIFDANREQIRNPDLIYPGQVFKVPEAEDSEPASDQG